MAKFKATKQPVVVGVELPECPVCTNNMSSPIFQCQSGHSLCSSCTKNLIPPICPICRQPMTQMRNWQLEEIVDKVKICCPNKSLGCVYTMMSSEVENHVKECIFREMLCPHGVVFGRCSWSGNLKEILDHFKDKHPQNTNIKLDADEEIKNISTTTDDRFMFLVTMGKNLFLLTIKVDTCQKMVYYAVQHFGSKRSAQQFIYEIQITSKQDSRRQVIFTDHCYNDTYNINEIFNTGKCGIMPLNMFSQFVQNNSLSLKLIIRRGQPYTKNKPKIEMNQEVKKPYNQNNATRGKSPAPHFKNKGPKSHGSNR